MSCTPPPAYLGPLRPDRSRVSTRPQAKHLALRHPNRRAFLATVVLAVIVGALVGTFLGRGTYRRPPSLARAGDSKTACIYVGSYPWQRALEQAEKQTGITYRCLETFASTEPDWGSWTSPWVIQPKYGYAHWLLQSPSTRTMVLTLTLIPGDLSDDDDPSTWEQPCDNGSYNQYAKQLAHNLVAAGFRYAVIRLGVEANGPWEDDFVGTTPGQQHDWALCFDNEARTMRSVPGAHFLFDWNVNACYEDIPFGRYYPGNRYVDIVGIDLYDASCSMSLPAATPLRWRDLAREPSGLQAFAAFAKDHHKPMSIPEWGLEKAPGGDDPYYVDGIAQFVHSHDVSFQTYFDADDDGIAPLGPGSPRSLAAYRHLFTQR